MGRTQWIAIAITSVLLLVTYQFCDVRPRDLDESLAQAPLAATGLESLIRAAREDLTPATMATLASLETELEAEEDEDLKTPILEQLAGEWYRAGHPAISGVYARRIAEAVQTEDAWSIAGTTFTLCIQKEQEINKTRQFCSSQAEQSYQAAISLDPDNIDNRINLALTYTESQVPMRGIQLLRDLEKQHPTEVRVYTTLAQLAIRTGQFEKAAQRLEKAAELDPENPDALCPLARVYENLENTEKSAIFAARCTAALEEKATGTNK